MGGGGLKILDLDGVAATAFKFDAAAVFGFVLPDPLVDQQLAIDPQPHAIVAEGVEDVVAGFQGFQHSLPADTEVIAAERRHRTAIAPIEVDLGIYPFNRRTAAEIDRPIILTAQAGHHVVRHGGLQGATNATGRADKAIG